MQPANGAFGLRFLGLESPRLLEPPEQRWPAVRVLRQRVGEEPAPAGVQPGAARLDENSAAVWLLDGGRVELDRTRNTATFLTPRQLTDEDLLHPYVRIAGALFGYWLGRETFHSGGFVAPEGVWGVLGGNQAGKSTMLAMLALAGYPVVADDLLVLEDRLALSGPRFVDLREPTASTLECGDQIVPSRFGMRRRLALSPIPAEAPLRGWVFLNWGPTIELRPIPPADRVDRLARLRTVQRPPIDPRALLDLARLPAWDLVRPRDLRSLSVVAERLIDLVSR